jgi:hypothetical protein
MSRAFDHAVSRAKKIWEYSHRAGLIPWFLRRIGVGRTVSAVWICRHSDGDWDKANFPGEPAAIWRYDGDGLTGFGALPPLDLTTPVVRFCADDAEQRMIYTEWHSPRAGVGLILRANEKGWWTVEKRRWIS